VKQKKGILLTPDTGAATVTTNPSTIGSDNKRVATTANIMMEKRPFFVVNLILVSCLLS
jgi:hypothetical protein